jgi:hypothetical protein
MVPDVLIRRGNELIEAEVNGEMVGLHVESGTCFGFNSTAYHIWRLIETPKSMAALCEALSQEYLVDLETCSDKVRPLLDDLAKRGLVQISRVG